MFDRSLTAPPSMAICGVAMSFTLLVFVESRSSVIESVPFVIIMLLDSVTPPVFVPISRT